MRYLKYIYALLIMITIVVISRVFDVSLIRYKFVLGFSIAAIVVLSFTIVLSMRNYLLMKKFDYLYFTLSYSMIAFVFGAAIISDFNYKIFRYYYFNFVKISEILIFFFGIFIIRERLKIKSLKKSFLFIIATTVIYFAILIYFSIFSLNVLLLYLGLLLLYSRIETKSARDYFIDIIMLKIISEIFDLAAETYGYGEFYLGTYIFFFASFVRLMFYFNSTLNKGYLGNFYMKEKMIRSLINSSNDGIVVMSGYFVKRINRQAMKILEFNDMSKVKGKNIFSLFDNLKKEDIDDIVTVFPNEITITLKKYNDRAKKYKVMGYQYKREDNEELVIIIRNPYYSNEFFYRINNEVDYVVYLYDIENKKYNYMNNSISKMIGYTPEEFYQDSSLGQKIVYEKDYDKYIEFFKLDIESGEEELRYRHKNGKIIWVLEKLSKVAIDGKEYYYGIVKDITKRKLEQMKIESKNNALEEINSKKDMSMSVVAHEIRSPITAIIGFLENILMNSAAIEDKTKGMIEKVYNNSMRLKELVNNLLDLNRINAEKYTPYMETIEVNGIIQEIITNNEILVNLKKLNIDNKIKGNIYIFVDENMFFQIINNLISNAIKYNKENGDIEVTALQETESVTIKITDTGIGIKENEKENVFKEYERGTGVKEKGSGIGLALVKKLVEINDGQIWFESELGKGSTFYVRFSKKRKEQNSKII